MISERIQGTMGKVSKDGQRQLAPSSKSKHQKDKDERKKRAIICFKLSGRDIYSTIILRIPRY